MTGLFWFVMGIVVTISVIIVSRKLLTYFNSKLPFKEILELVKNRKLSFDKRLGDLVYFTGYKNLTTIYNIKKWSISVHDDDTCVFVTLNSNQEISDEIIDELDAQFYNDIYRKIYVINGTTYSENMREITSPTPPGQNRKPINNRNEDSKPSVVFLLEEDVEGYVEEMDIERILSKVETMGLDSLSTDEMSFIEDIDNWKVD